MIASAADHAAFAIGIAACAGAAAVGAAIGAGAYRRLLSAAAIGRVRPAPPSVSQSSTSRRGLLSRGVAAVNARRGSRTRRRVDASAVAALLDRTARRCSSGESLAGAFSAAVTGDTLEGLFAPTLTALRVGETMAGALQLQPVEHTDIALAVHVLRLCAAEGGNISESLDRAAAALRERDAVVRERHAQSAQARLSAHVMTLLPIGFGGWTMLTTRSVRAFVITPLGLACLGTGLVLNVTGWVLMNRVIRGTR